ncbi:hypothetical protein SAMN05216349_1278 [Oribacterium sp. KHPX15]|uniref:hypothetical protein n=1 Tax=Oribacterium sp. KHPX15 TaxID=1855342 RepID=UPI000894D9A7|nr:hypothetical protein [Oribacterium sp. KHPX15]SEA76016.1 hypothetical protein SAMN05216349_1278 [Oribacterium sp. KHPX15]
MDRTGGGGSRQRNTTSGSSRVSTRGSGLGLGGPVGNSGGYNGRPGLGDRGGGGNGCSGCGCVPGFIFIVIIIIAMIYNGGSQLISTVLHTAATKVEDGSVKDGIDTGIGAIQDAVQGITGGSGENNNGRAGLISGSSKVDADQSAKSLLTNSYQDGNLLPISGGQGIIPGLAAGSALSSAAGGTSSGQNSQGYADPEGKAIDPSHLVWSKNKKGQRVLILTDDEWDAVEYVKLNVFVDTGSAFIDLGLDNLYDFDDDLNLIGEFDDTWLSLDKHVVAFYQLDGWHEGSKYQSRGYIPAFVNGQHANIVLQFDNTNPDGKILGVKPLPDSPGGDLSTEEMCSGLELLNEGDLIEPICDVYSYEGDFIDNYFLGEGFEVGEKPLIANIALEEGTVTSVAYRLTDYDGHHYWTPLIE